MPSPGVAAIVDSIGNTRYQVEGGFSTEIKKESPTVQKLAAGMHAGWTSATPSTVTTMATTIPAAVGGILAGPGLAFFTAIGTGIDQETALWAASWIPVSVKHAYAPSADAIVSKIMAASPVQSAGAKALAERAAAAFIEHFVQEVG